MNTFLGPEEQSLLASYRDYAKETVAPVAFALDQAKLSALELVKKFGQEGFLGLFVPKEYGGQGASFFVQTLFVEAISEYEPGLSLIVASHLAATELILKHGTDKQKSRYLPLLARGECIATLALTEEQAGSDLAAVTASVAKDGEEWVLTGKKTGVVAAEMANLALVLARLSGGEPGRLSLWLVDMDGDSTSVLPDKGRLGLRSAPIHDVEIKSLGLAADSYLGSVNPEKMSDDKTTLGFVEDAQNVSKVVMASAAIGLLTRATQLSVEHANAREQFGSSIGRLQAIQWKLADMSADSSAARLLTYRAAWSKDNAPAEFSKFASMCKLQAAKAARVHSQEAVQIYGALGVEAGTETEKMYRDSKLLEILEGTSEIQKNIIAEEVGV
ncbi:MAG: acyl-CoA dehydrogenase family protein [Cyanobacteria bacterium]|nr:acyl-CoA dehydrogenase family protein [Cyanobacteriota bacterium]